MRFARARTELMDAVTEVKRNPKLQTNILPRLRLVLQLDTLSAAERCDRIGNVTLSIESAMSADAKRLRPHIMNQLISTMRLVTSWVEALSAELKTPSNLRAIRTFRHVVLKSADNLPVGSYVAGVKRYAHV